MNNPLANTKKAKPTRTAKKSTITPERSDLSPRLGQFADHKDKRTEATKQDLLYLGIATRAQGRISQALERSRRDGADAAMAVVLLLAAAVELSKYLTDAEGPRMTVLKIVKELFDGLQVGEPMPGGPWAGCQFGRAEASGSDTELHDRSVSVDDQLDNFLNVTAVEAQKHAEETGGYFDIALLFATGAAALVAEFSRTPDADLAELQQQLDVAFHSLKGPQRPARRPDFRKRRSGSNRPERAAGLTPTPQSGHNRLDSNIPR